MNTPSPRVYIVGEDGPLDELLALAEHGDLLVQPGARSLGVSFVRALDEGGAACPKRLEQKDETGAGYTSVPLSISRHFADPVGTYLPVLAGARTGLRTSDWLCIELDPVAHRDVLATVTRHGPIGAGRRVVYFLSGDEAPGYAIWNPDLPGDTSKPWKKLNRSTPKKLLGAEVHYLTARELGQIQRKHAALHTIKFLRWLRTRQPGDTVDTLSVPADINHREASITHGSSVTFVGLEEHGERCSVRTSLREYTDWDPVTGARNHRDLELMFAPEFLAESGPWGNVTFWVNRAHGRYLVPPLWNPEFKALQ